MFDLASIVTYVAVVIGLFLIPGPAVLLVITRTLQGGRKVGKGLSGLRRWEGKIIGTLFVGLGVKVAFQQR
jgi:threonine/homoserine/homoserine lactone efflux protein